MTESESEAKGNADSSANSPNPLAKEEEHSQTPTGESRQSNPSDTSASIATEAARPTTSEAPHAAESSDQARNTSTPGAGISAMSASENLATTGGVELPRRSGWLESCSKTFQYIAEVSKDKALHLRHSDKITTRLLIISLIGSLIFAAFPFFEMRTLAACCYVVADLMLIAAILVFVMSRLGIIRAMAPRHALICWHLMVGTGLLFLVIGFNLVAAVVLIMLRDRLPTFLGG